MDEQESKSGGIRGGSSRDSDQGVLFVALPASRRVAATAAQDVGQCRFNAIMMTEVATS